MPVSPSLCYISQLAELLEVNALNQGIGGAMFDPIILSDLENLPEPDLVTIAYGTNDLHNALSISAIRDKINAFFARLQQLYPLVTTYVITPIWRDDMNKETKSGCFADVTRLIREIACSLPSVRLIDGPAVSPHNPACYSDGYLHPNTAGFSYMAARLFKKMLC